MLRSDMSAVAGLRWRYHPGIAFDGFMANPQGLSIEGRVAQILSKEDWKLVRREYGC